MCNVKSLEEQTEAERATVQLVQFNISIIAQKLIESCFKSGFVWLWTHVQSVQCYFGPAQGLVQSSFSMDFVQWT